MPAAQNPLAFPFPSINLAKIYAATDRQKLAVKTLVELREAINILGNGADNLEVQKQIDALFEQIESDWNNLVNYLKPESVTKPLKNP